MYIYVYNNDNDNKIETYFQKMRLTMHCASRVTTVRSISLSP